MLDIRSHEARETQKRKWQWEEEDDRNANGIQEMKGQVPCLALVLNSTRGQARDKSTEAGCSRLTPVEDQEI